MGNFGVQFRRDLLVAIRARTETANPIAFFVLALSLFVFAVGTDSETLPRVAPGVVWVVALFAAMLSTENLFQRDHDDGSLELMLLDSRPLFLGVLGKLLAHWSVSGLPVAILSPLAAVFINAPFEIIAILVGTLLLGTPVLTLIGGIGAALTAGLGRGGLLLAVLVMPLYIPVLIFGSGACYRVLDGATVTGPVLWLTALLAGSITLAPFAIGAALRGSQEY
ncbi:MAG TPA: heme exporter protein CcmB [Gammaproteobacteria bacterium]|nr:heme exporter protein CcmB [Gammaproteobacteria bacterium]